MPDGPRTSPDPATDQKSRLAGPVPGPAPHDHTTATTAVNVRQWDRLRAPNTHQLLLHVQFVVDVVLFVMCVSLLCEL